MKIDKDWLNKYEDWIPDMPENFWSKLTEQDAKDLDVSIKAFISSILVEEKCEQTGELKVHNFKCSVHGVINPIPKCPGCLKFPIIEELPSIAVDETKWSEAYVMMWRTINELIRAVNLLRK